MKVSDLPSVRALCGELEMVEEAIGKHSYRIGLGYQSIEVQRDATHFQGQRALHEAVRRGLMQYRKDIIAHLRDFGAEVDEEKLEGDNAAESERA